MAIPFLTKIFGSRNDRLLKQYRKTVERINALEAGLEALSDDALRAAIHHGAPETELRALALQGGMTLLRDDGQRLVDAGISTAEELWRVTRD